MAISTTIKLKFDGAAVKRGLAGLRSQFSSAIKSIGKIGLGAIGLGGVAIAGITAIGVKLNAIGEEGRAVDARLSSITKQMGLFGNKSGEVSDRLSDLADTQGRILGIDDDVISNTEAKLMTFKELAKTADVVGGSFDRATMAAIDMAAAGFGEAEQNAVQLGKALNDPIKGITSLTKSGITFTASEKSVIKSMVETGQQGAAMNVVLSAIEKQVGGTAAAVSTASSRMKVSFGQIIEEFSKNFSEGFNSLPGRFEGVFMKFKETAGRYGRAIAEAIADSINGNHDKFLEIGSIIGTIISAGIKAQLFAGFHQKAAGKMFDAYMTNENVAGRIAEATGNGPKPYQRSTQGQIDYEMKTQGYSDTAAKVQEMQLNELRGINQKLAPQP